MTRAEIDEPVRRLGESETQGVRFTGPWRYVMRMGVFVLIATAAVIALFGAVRAGFLANVAINGLIVTVLTIGVAYTFRQALMIGPSASWLTRFAAAKTGDAMTPAPSLIAPMTAMLADASKARWRLSAASMRSVLDSVGARMSEAGETTRYIGRLLIFLGLLGTFWGLLQTVGAVGDAVRALAGSGEPSDDDVLALLSALEEPVRGMGTAFSSSLFGLAGSLVIGFLDLQASQAQNRFYNEIEEWLSSMSRVSGAVGGVAEDEDGGGRTAAWLGPLVEQMTDAIEAVHGSAQRSTETLNRLAQAVVALSDRLEAQEQALERLGRSGQDGGAQLKHLRNLDAGLQTLSAELAGGREQTVRELRSDLRRLSRTLALAIESGAEPDEPA
ncbi:MAG: hypothetical protein ACFB2Z_03615 [Maricaulaceae bacterium]